MIRAGSSQEVSTVVKSGDAAFNDRPERLGAFRRLFRNDVDLLQRRQAITDLGQLLPAALIGDDGLRFRIGQAIFQRVLAEQREQRNRDHAGTECRDMRDRQFQRLRQEHRDAVALHETVGLEHVGKAPRHLRDLVERGARGGAVLVDIDQRQPARSVRVPIAARVRHVEASRNVPAEIAVEIVIGGGFGEHGAGVFPWSFFCHGRSEPAIEVLLGASLKTWMPGTRPGMTLKVSCSRRDQPDSAAFTMPLALPKSIWPANFARSTPITLPMSFIPAAPVSAIAAEIAAFTSSSDICFGR